MVWGFTGTRKGMSPTQKLTFAGVVRRFMCHGDEFHHGAADGADTEANDFLESTGGKPLVRIKKHPARGRPLQRDKEIVALAEVLIAAPATDTEVRRSGTWATIRYARAKGIPVLMLSRGGER